eukprot:TRINITY_DN13152_c0_g2_i3.p1 TRINITY_DN13152_c0_g2~~TRINITY_DN13152_c0_g2_i3.p1  ORF type:complete len:175 (-),score=48.39 TRINITY_DN13152_c0_g2_i3:157-681(-)
MALAVMLCEARQQQSARFAQEGDSVCKQVVLQEEISPAASTVYPNDDESLQQGAESADEDETSQSEPDPEENDEDAREHDLRARQESRSFAALMSPKSLPGGSVPPRSSEPREWQAVGSRLARIFEAALEDDAENASDEDLDLLDAHKAWHQVQQRLSHVFSGAACEDGEDDEA